MKPATSPFMKPFLSSAVLSLFAACLFILTTPRLAATVDDALSFALEAATPYVEEGFTVREDFWGGDLAVKEPKAIAHQLFRGLEYWFWLGTDIESAKISVNIYDKDGNLVNAEQWQRGKFAAVRVVPESTGTYYVRIEIEESPEERTPWGLAYGYK